MLRGMDEGQMKMASKRRTEQRTTGDYLRGSAGIMPDVLCKAAMGSPFTAKKCWLALTEALSARPERTGSGNTELIRLLNIY